MKAKLGAWKLALGVAAVLGLGAAGLAAWIAWPLPPALLAPAHRTAVTLTDRHGLPLRSTRAADGSLARWVPLAEMDPDLIAAFLAAEDRRFYQHGALDLRAVARAAWANLRVGRVISGASTITMQLARLVHPSPRTWSGKMEQALWALRLEHHLGKQAILEQYLNRVPLGQATVGVESAATLYAGGTAADLSLGQAAMLAGLARAPSSDNPIVSLARARARRAVVLRRLVERGYASASAAERAQAEPLLTRGATVFLAPHFTTRLLQWAEDSAPGVSGIWRTSLDLALQERLESEVRHTVELLRSQGAQHAAAVVLDNASGEILAWVGSPDFWADTAGQVDMVNSPRQPGSALKPFLYGLAFDRGYTPAAVLPDLPQVYQTGTGPYSPRNYDRRFHGPVRAREALASSFNLPAVELANRLSVASLLATLHQAGFASLARSAEYYGLGLALGNGDVTLLELANGYRAIANGGRWRPYRWRPALADGQGEPGRRVMSPLAAALVLDVLSDPVARLPGFGLETPFDFPFPAAVKTGTSRHFTDNWAVGVTGGFTAAVWVGNFSGRPMDGVSGVSGAGPLLRRAMLATAERYAPGVLPAPRDQGAVPVAICRASGMLAGEHCPTMTEWVQPGLAPSHRCDWHGPDGLHLPAEYAEWASAAAGPAMPVANIAATAVASDSVGRFRIVAPRDGDRYEVPPGVDRRYATLALRAGGAGAANVRWYVDGRAVQGGRWPLTPGAHRIRAEGSGGARDEVRIDVR
ncbi:MAG TPA: penicillin-binding protein 1C [Gemmatimonadales bacterium]|nr:penicillin-binding protein 1C [Gemmatimonadales bacterium]